MSRHEKQKSSLLAIGIGGAVLLLAAVMLFVFLLTRPKPEEGQKQITFEVILTDGSSTEFSFSTQEEYLGKALQEEKLIEGTQGDYGLWVTTVNGVKADESKQEWWCFTKNKEMVNTGVDLTPIYDGDRFEATLTVGY